MVEGATKLVAAAEVAFWKLVEQGIATPPEGARPTKTGDAAHDKVKVQDGELVTGLQAGDFAQGEPLPPSISQHESHDGPLLGIGSAVSTGKCQGGEAGLPSGSDNMPNSSVERMSSNAGMDESEGDTTAGGDHDAAISDASPTSGERKAQNGGLVMAVAAPASKCGGTEVFCATDIAFSGMNKTMSDWNLSKLVHLSSNVLKYCRQTRAGVTSPCMQFAMIFSKFCWRAEENDLYSISYLHSGCPKTWYGVPADGAPQFEEALKKQATTHVEECEDMPHSESTMLPGPGWLVGHGHKVARTVQEQGHFVVSFPRVYYAGFSHGANVSEAVNFATADWLPHGRAAADRYRQNLLRSPTIQHEQLLLELAGSVATAGPQILAQTRAELHAVRTEYGKLLKEMENSDCES